VAGATGMRRVDDERGPDDDEGNDGAAGVPVPA
jgi:hypothetical protein